jgi:prevent-host-death family protein
MMQKIIPITDLQRAAGQIITDLNDADDSPVVITHRGRPAAVLLSAERYAQMESDLERLDELELVEMVESARAARAAGDIISHDEVKKRLSKSRAAMPKPSGRARK